MTDIRSFFNKNKKKAPPDSDKDDLPVPSRATDDYVSDDDFSTNANKANIPLDSSAVDTAVDTINTVVPSINDLLLKKISGLSLTTIKLTSLVLFENVCQK